MKKPLYSHRLVITLLAAAILLITRRMDSLTYPQFFAEDGNRWFSDAYNNPWGTLFVPAEQYLQTLPRLIALLEQLVPLRYAPLLNNFFALCSQLLPVAYLVSRRSPFGSLVGIMLAVMYIALPNIGEMHLALTMTQWPLTLAALLMILAPKAPTVSWRVTDLIVTGACVLTGPLAVVLLPCALFVWRNDMDRHRSRLMSVFTVGALAQGVSYLFSSSTRPAGELGASITRLLELIGGHVVISGLLGTQSYAELFQSEWRSTVSIIAAIIGISILLLAICKRNIPFLILLGFSCITLTLGLLSPTVGIERPQWETMTWPGACARYWIIPTFSFYTALFLIFFAPEQGLRSRIEKMLSGLLIACALFGVVRSWKLPAWPDYHFAAYAEQFEASPAGTRIEIPIAPPGWKMTLVKKAS